MAEEPSVYDRRAATYDRVIGSALYNRIVWGASTVGYTDFARSALDSGNGPYLDVGCGSLVFTADAYRAAARELVLTDLSEGMLGRAADRVSSANATLIRADLFDLPFDVGSFETVASFGVLHCIGDLDGALRAIADQVRPGGRVFLTSLVAETRRGKGMLRLLRRAGEVAEPRTRAQFVEAVARHLEIKSTALDGSMLAVVASPLTK